MNARSSIWLAALIGLATMATAVPAHAGACCFDDGSCQEVSSDECSSLGGSYQGGPGGCESVQCAGACYIMPGGVCFDDTWPDLCETLGGIYAGFGTDCDTLMAMPAGACCFYDENCNLLCEVVSKPFCDAAGGVYQGDGTVCDPNPCEDFGACCFAVDLSCEDQQIEQDCIDMGGFWQGACTTCAEITCPVAAACCFADGACSELTHDECVAQGGLYQGFGNACNAIDCTGACCFDDGTCLEDQTFNECEVDLGGNFQGYGTICEPDFCPAICQVKTYSFNQTKNAQFVVLEDFEKFDTMGGLRTLEGVIVELDGQIVARVVLTNLGDDPFTTGVEKTEYLAVSDFPTLTPPPLIGIDVFEVIYCFDDPFYELPPGEECDFGSPLVFPTVTTGEVEVADLNQFIGPGTFDVQLEANGNFFFGESNFNLLQSPHKAEGMVRVCYQYSVNGACCFCIKPCEVLPEEDCLNDPEFYSFHPGLLCSEVDCPVFGCNWVTTPPPGYVACPGEEDLEFVIEEISGEPGVQYEWEVSGDCEFCETPVGDTAFVCADDVCGGSCTVLARTIVGNCVNECEYMFSVDDLVAPTITCPPNDTFECEADVPDPATNLSEFLAQGGSVSDNCPGPITVTWLGDTPLTDPCGGTIERTYEATDQCGNPDTCVQTFTVNDTTDPTISCPPNETFECEGDIPPPAANLAEFEAQGGSVSDNCDGPITVQWLGDTPLTDPCGGTVERQYQAEDQCNNLSDICVQVFTVDDTTAPTITCPSDDSFECESDVPPPAGNLAEFEALGGTVSDNCPGPITVTWLGDSPLSDPCGGTIERTYEAKDRCENAQTCIQTFTIDDVTAPSITCPPNDSFECESDLPAPATTLAEFEAQGGSASDNCGGEITIQWLGDSDPTDPCGGTIDRQYRALDECGNPSPICTQTFTIDDTTAPSITCPPNATYECEPDVPAPATTLAEFEAQGGSVNDNCVGPITIEWLGDTPLSDPCGGTIDRQYQAKDQCDNTSPICTQTFTVDDTTPPAIFCPPDVQVNEPSEVPPPAMNYAEFIAQGGWVDDNCDGPFTVEWLGDDPANPDECPFEIVRTYRAFDLCDNASEPCEQIIECPPPGGDEGGCDEKGSLLFFSKVELRWDNAGYLIQDTFLSLTNDYPDDVWVQMYFINGDPPLEAEGNERPHPGWNGVDNRIRLTANQPVYWSVLTGLPTGVSPFTILDPGDPPGRPAMDGTNDRVLRGYVVAWAVNDDNSDEIKWNHLAGNGTLVHYGGGAGWEYKACAFQVVDNTVDHGQETGTPGVLNLDGSEYDSCSDLLLMNFQAVGSSAYSADGAAQIVSNTDLTLHPASADLRQNTDGPVATKADIDIWNQWEARFSAHRCIACWDQTLLEFYSIPNHFLVWTLQTDHGKARIDGVPFPLCNLDLDGDGVDDIQAESAALIGLVAKLLTIDGGAGMAAAGTNLFGMGGEAAIIEWDVEDGGPPPAPGLPADPTKGELLDFLNQFLEQMGGQQTDR